MIWRVFIVLMSCFGLVTAQNTIYNKGFLLTPTFAFHLPGADLSERFGPSFNFGMESAYKFKKNWQVGLEGTFLFGNKVKEDNILESMLVAGGNIINNTGELEGVGLTERGTTIKLFAGKSFPFNQANPESGILVKAGIGYMHHKILIDVNRNTIPQLNKEYRTGFDRLSSGFMLHQFIGIMKLEKGKFVNVYLGLELMEGFTNMRRSWDLASNSSLKENRFDFLIGLKFGWIIPVFTGQTTDDEYYY